MATQKELMESAKAYIQRKQYDDARRILLKIDHPTAKDWLLKLDELSPHVMKHEEAWENPINRMAMIAGLLIFGLILAVIVATVFNGLIPR